MRHSGCHPKFPDMITPHASPAVTNLTYTGTRVANRPPIFYFDVGSPPRLGILPPEAIADLTA